MPPRPTGAGGKLGHSIPPRKSLRRARALAQIFKLPENQVRVTFHTLGGGYGGKTHARLEPALCIARAQSCAVLCAGVDARRGLSHRQTVRRGGENKKPGVKEDGHHRCAPGRVFL